MTDQEKTELQLEQAVRQLTRALRELQKISRTLRRCLWVTYKRCYRN